jgi:hypothetical protein
LGQEFMAIVQITNLRLCNPIWIRKGLCNFSKELIEINVDKSFYY